MTHQVSLRGIEKASYIIDNVQILNSTLNRTLLILDEISIRAQTFERNAADDVVALLDLVCNQQTLLR
ncbi:hypothetical protein PC116_g7965 [Phytophthora cactorum]|uniref:Uncharacterized protein n=1 Tax=Phytophthora cactorum TaxID=29920 RepID=A0A8T1E663_9STRA|nr:hypothetical protein PC117_g7029 [Phytophthora cactorum]KAG3031483.1 hypothetical protein PC120_g3111 [Phytophthora cactorum]KAG3181825.1 hypothetical protein C6341_g6245 [Phytophthora cactorum]KAG4061237.1 hypothetical protein PC123_g3855 [Phytophthora cactorum]KAG4244208.1 hypothetical protein PC116_g7965 [Phytophthora cactorum]